MQRVLVVYFSRTGYTKRIAEEIAARCRGDLEAIDDVRGRKGILGYLRSAREAYKKLSIEIRAAAKKPADYDVVIVGTPVWAGNMSSPVRAFLSAHRNELDRVGLFCTQGGSGADKVLRDMADLCGRKPLASLALSDRDIKRDRYADELTGFLRGLALPKAA